MISLSRTALKMITDAAEAAYPRECCGLLAGRIGANGDLMVNRVVVSANVSTSDTRDSFEVDPEVRFYLMRELEEAGTDERIIGHYHSHPNNLAHPSERDLAMAYEPDLVWVISAVEGGTATDTRAHKVNDDATAFREIPLCVTGSAPYASALKTTTTE